MKAEIKNQIENCKNIGEYLTVLENNYLLAECKPGKFSKNILIQSLSSKLQNIIIDNYVREKAVNSNNMLEFLDVVRKNFNTDIEFTKDAKSKLMLNTGFIINLVMLKEKPEPTNVKTK